METHDAEQAYCIVAKANLFFDQDIKQLAAVFEDGEDY
jgi:hypothetical protein